MRVLPNMVKISFFKNRVFIAVSIIALLLLGAFGYWEFIRAKPSPLILTVRDMTFVDYSGNPASISDLKGKPLVVTTFATWCPFCADELALWAEETARGGFNVLAINRAEPKSVALPYASRFAGSDIVFLSDPEDRFFTAIEGYAMPETLFISADGGVVFRRHGPFENPDALREALARFLAESGE